jgi:hypothetical protein
MPVVYIFIFSFKAVLSESLPEHRDKKEFLSNIQEQSQQRHQEAHNVTDPYTQITFYLFTRYSQLLMNRVTRGTLPVANSIMRD